MKNLEFTITEEIYNRAVESNSGSCIVAEAIKEAYPNLSSVRVNAATIRVSDREAGERYTFLTPQIAVDALLFFDQGWKEENLPMKIRARALVKIIPITRSPSSIKSEAEQRAKRLAELEAKQERGEELTGEEKRSLTRIQNRREPIPRPTSRGPIEVEDNGVIRGGDPIPEKNRWHGKTHPNMLAGKDRHFGQKTAQAGRAFREAVQKAAEEMAKEMVVSKKQRPL